MNTAVCLHDIAHLSDFQRKRGILERLLHLPGAKDSKIPLLASGTAI